MNQIESEIKGLFDFIKYIYTDVFKMEYQMRLGTRPEKSLGTAAMWKDAEDALPGIRVRWARVGELVLIRWGSRLGHELPVP